MLCALGTAIGGVVASRVLFNNLITAFLHAPMAFFDTNPIGRLLNRCSEDIVELDYVMPFTVRSMVNCVLLIAGTLGVTVYTTHLVAAIIPLPAVGYWAIQVGCCSNMVWVRCFP